MANVVLFDPKQRPEYALAKQEASSLTKGLAGGGGFSGKRISIKGGVFRLISDGKEVAAIEERHLDVVIVRGAEHIGRTYYSKTYDEDAPAAPDCWSPDGVVPDSTASNPQSEQCATCPQNVKGSGNEDSRACRFSQRVAVVLANDMSGDVMQVSLPATSLFGKEEGDNRPLQAYARYITSGNARIEQFITRLKFDTTVATPKLFFKPMRWLVDSEHEISKEQGTTDAALKAVTMTVAQTDKVAPAALAPGVPLKPAKAPAPVVHDVPADDEPPPPPPPGAAAAPAAAKKGRGRPKKNAAPAADVEPPIAAPTLRATPSAPTLPPRKSVGDVVAQWGDED